MFSVIDYPVNSIIKNGLFSCGDCANEVVAGEREIVWDEK